jgi:phosphatidylserine synthase
MIIANQIPYEKVWAGKLNSEEEMKSFETISIILNIFILTILIVKYKQLKRKIKNRAVNILISAFAVFFTLNTLGNLFAKSTTELILGTFITLSSYILCFIIAKKKKYDLLKLCIIHKTFYLTQLCRKLVGYK